MIRGNIDRLDSKRCDLLLGGEKFKNVRYCTGIVLLIQLIFCRVIAVHEVNSYKIVWINKKSLSKNSRYQQYCQEHRGFHTKTLKQVLRSLSSVVPPSAVIRPSVAVSPPVVVSPLKPTVDWSLKQLGPSALMIYKMINRGPHSACTSDGERADRMLEIDDFMDCVCNPDYLTSIANVLYENHPEKEKILKCFNKSLSSDLERNFMQSMKKTIETYPKELLQVDRGALSHAESGIRKFLFWLFTQSERGESFHYTPIRE